MSSKSATNTRERRVRETMEVLDRPDVLPPDPHFYGRVMARLAQGERLRGGFTGLLEPVLLSALVILNLATAIWVLGVQGRQESVWQRAAFAQALAADLNLTGEPRSLLVEDRE